MALKRKLFFVLLSGAAVMAFACGGSEDDASEAAGGSDAKKFFIERVHAPVSETCNQCHQTGKSGSPVFLGSSANASYIAIEGFPGLIAPPNLSPLVQKGVHSGPALSSVQTPLVEEWLKLEVKERKLTNDPGAPKNLRAAFQAFGACMDYTKWVQLKLHTIANVTTENNQGQCRSCHNYGQASLWLAGGRENPNDIDVALDDPENALTFHQMRQFPYVQRLVVGRVNGEGAFDGIEASRRIVDKGTEAQQLQANSHPRYAIPTDLVNNLTQYVLETISNVNANRCQNVTSPDADAIDAAIRR